MVDFQKSEWLVVSIGLRFVSVFFARVWWVRACQRISGIPKTSFEHGWASAVCEEMLRLCKRLNILHTNVRPADWSFPV